MATADSMKAENGLILGNDRSILLDDIANHLVALADRWSFRLDLLRTSILPVAIVATIIVAQFFSLMIGSGSEYHLCTWALERESGG